MPYTYTVTGTGGDNTSALQAAIDDNSRGKKYIRIEGNLGITKINLASTVGITVEGDGIDATEITPLLNDANAVLDVSGTSFCQLKNFRLGRSGGSIIPKVGILALQNASNASNWMRLENLFVDGAYSKAAFYNYGVASSKADGCAFWNYANDAYCVEFTSDNVLQLGSEYMSVALGNGRPMSDWTFTGCEFHSQRPVGPCNAFAMRLSGARDMRFVGGNFSGSGYAYITMRSDSGGRKCKNLIFLGPTFYSENGQAPQYVFNVADVVEGFAGWLSEYQATTAIFDSPSLISHASLL